MDLMNKTLYEGEGKNQEQLIIIANTKKSNNSI